MRENLCEKCWGNAWPGRYSAQEVSGAQRVRFRVITNSPLANENTFPEEGFCEVHLVKTRLQ